MYVKYKPGSASSKVHLFLHFHDYLNFFFENQENKYYMDSFSHMNII